MKDEKTIVIDINLTRGLVALLALALLGVALLGYLAWGRDEVAASGPQAPLDLAQDRPLAQSSGMRQYYLTKQAVKGYGPLSACASGYHMASLWEIMDPSNLEYNRDLGEWRDDSGQGPPSLSPGWVRTGYDSIGGPGAQPGRSNCRAWSSMADSDAGTWANLTSEWGAGYEDIHVWLVNYSSCNSSISVWCVED